ncbi:related to URB1 - nucleolar protein required for the normal accumulation of 25S and 5.8S rRNAs [Ustilago trichophora]|uniref:Related to URB1 - nucleolar protein required for the normal accumulation of 25S and 5.8S rRNAs n=1 Tax=Ustilago trichophora TaxID=86804 RepID=A0A5C3EPX0_9BASI|nr:related to URB1 - nucleolar protein required for the normal accumulation of 25S and 5.8S rRNAs [Ustilago trichophora]
MVDKRKRAGSDAASSAHHASDASEDEQVVNDQPVMEEPAQNKALIPFADASELHEALKTPSADMLRLLLSRLRNQTSLSFAENTQRSTISASDKRIQLVKEYCQLCEIQASNSGAPISAAASIFSTWELADRQDLPTLLHLPIFCLAQSLALLSIHYPTHSLGSNIIERILSPNEPWLAMLHNYISNLGGAKFASSKQRDSRSFKSSDVAALASLVLLREITTFAKGRYAAKLFDSFNWSMKVLPHIFNMRRRVNRKSKTSKKAQAVQDVSLRRPDIRTLYILFLLSFLQQSYSHALKLRLLDLGRDFLPAILKGLPQDPPDVVQTILLHLHEDLVKDQRIPRSKKVEFWNEWACGCVVQLYSREEEHVLIHADTEAVENPSVAELAHHFLLSICTNPGFGICYPDRGWYPRKAAARNDTADSVGQGTSDALLDGLDRDEFTTEANSAQKAKQSGGPIYNKVLSGVLRQLAVAEDLRQQELALSILTACPELAGPYLESSCAGLSVDPRPSSRWLCNIAFFGRVVGLELPSFRVAKVEHLETPDSSAAGALTPLAHRQFASEPPPLSSILANVLPGPLHRFLFSQGLNSSDRLVRYSTCALLCRCLDRMVRFRNVCLSAITELDEDESGPWRRRLDALELEARRRIPDISIVIQILQVATSRSGANGTSNAMDAEDGSIAEETGAVSEKNNMLSTEVALRLLSLYYQAVPSSAFDVRFNAGKLLTNAFIQASASAATKAVNKDAEMANGDDLTADNGSSNEDGDDSGDEDEEDSGEVNLEALCQVHTLRILSHSARAASFDWTAKPTGSGNNLSYLGMLLTLFISTPLEQVKQACEDLLRSLLASSSFFEHCPAEIDAWLASLPSADTQSTQIDEETGRIAGAAIGSHQLSEEQQVVVAFLDECMLRCAKTPYRYVEAARQFLQEHDQDSHVNADGISSKDASADLLASPWLMAVFEQFAIRVEKGLFATEMGTVDALTALFVRLLPVLCAYTRHTSALEAMAMKIKDHIKGNAKYASSTFLASTILSKITSIRQAPVTAFTSTKQSKQANKILFNGSSTPADLKTRLRSAQRPLNLAQISDLYAAVQKLHESGYASVSQILEELDPLTENITAAVFPQAFRIEYGTVPVLHLPSNAEFTTPARDDFMATNEAPKESPLVPWQAKHQVRLAIWTAIFRSSSDGDKDAEGELLAHMTSLILMVDASGFLGEEEAKQFLFVEAANHIDYRNSHYAARLLRLISDLAIQYLDPQRKEHHQMIRTVLYKLDQDQEYNDDWYKAMTNLVPFLDEDSVLEILETCTRVLHTLEADAPVSLLAADALSVIVTSLDRSSRIWRRLVMRLPEIVDAASRTDSADTNEDEKRNDDKDGGSREDLLFGIISSALQHAQHRADTSLREAVAKLDLSELVQAETASSAKDSALVAAIHAHPALARSVSRSVLCLLSSNDKAKQEQIVQTLPCTLLTLLSALLEEGCPQIAGETWTEAHIKPIVNLASSAILGTSEDSVELVEKHAACLVLTLRCACKFGWSDLQEEVASRLSTFAKDAVATTPAKAFRGPLIQVLLGIVEDVPDFSGLSGLLQATVDAALLWLVRRFAEDSNDSIHLVQTIKLFTSLIERIGDDGRQVQLKKSLVDPVIQAAIKNRLRAFNQMHLVLALCVHAELEPTHLSRYLGALSAHSDFNTVMRGTAAIQHPLQAEHDADEEEDSFTAEEKHEKSGQLQKLMVELVYTIASRDPKELLRAPLLTKLMSFYGATLIQSDRMLLSMFRKFEEESGHSFAALAQGWTLPSAQQGASGSGQENTLEALQSLDANVVFATCTDYPRSLSLANTIASGYEEADEESALPGQVYGRHADASQRYDPVFLSSLLAGVTAPGVKLSGLQWLAVFATNVPGLVVCGLSSRSADMRRASLTLISNLYLAIREADFQEKDHLIMVLDLLRDALDSSVAIQDDSSSSDAHFLPTTTTLFIAHALRSVTTPSSFIYPVISHFLLQRPELDVGDIPLLYNLLYTASDKYKQERMWMLRFLRDVARSGGRSDWKILKRRRTWELLASLYDACDAATGTGISAERAVEETAIRALVEDTTSWLVKNPDVGIELVTRRGLFVWIWQQLVREGVVALAEHISTTSSDTQQKNETAVDAVQSAGTLRSVWILLLAQLLRSIDLDRLHRATDSAWIATTLNLTLTILKALHNCVFSPSSALPNVSAELVRTISCAASVVLEKILIFSEDPSLAMHGGVVVEALEKLLNLAEEYRSESKETEQVLIRIQRSALNLAPTVGTNRKAQKSLARLIRKSTAMCKQFDVETASLVLGNLFASNYS